MTLSPIQKTGDPARLVEATPAPEEGEKSVAPPSGPLVTRPLKPRGPVIAGGIIRFGLGGTRSDEP